VEYDSVTYDILPPINSFVHVKWLEAGEKLPGWKRAHIDQYFLAINLAG